MLYLAQNESQSSAPPLRSPYTRQLSPRRPRRLSYLADGTALPALVDPTDAANQVVTQAQYSGAKMTQTEMNAIIQTASTGQLPFGPADWATQFNCSGVDTSQGAAKLTLTATGMAVSIGGSIASQLSIAGTLAVSVPVIGAIVGGIMAVIGLFSAILQHHAQAMAKEENILCAVVPSLNQALAAIQNAIADGTLTPQAASGTLDNVVSEFSSAVSSIIKNDNSHCNAACVWLKCLQAYVIVAKSQYAQQIAQAAAQAASDAVANSSAVTSVTNAAGQVVQQVTSGLSTMPGWVWLVLAGGTFLLLED